MDGNNFVLSFMCFCEQILPFSSPLHEGDSEFCGFCSLRKVQYVLAVKARYGEC